MSNVIRVVKNCNYTTLSNYHFKDKRLSWKAKGLLSTMLSLPDNWNYTIEGLASLSDDGVKATNSGLAELEKCGYLIREQLRDSKGHFVMMEYTIYEKPIDQPEEEPPKSAEITEPLHVQEQEEPLCQNGQTEENGAFSPLCQNGQTEENGAFSPLCQKRQTGKRQTENGSLLNTYVLNTKELSTYPSISLSNPIDQAEMDEDEMRRRQIRERLLNERLYNTCRAEVIAAVFAELCKREEKIVEVMSAEVVERICFAAEEQQRREPGRRLSDMINSYIDNIVVGIRAAPKAETFGAGNLLQTAASSGSDRGMERESYRKLIRKNIEYDCLIKNKRYGRKEKIDELVELMLDILCSKRQIVCIAGDDYPVESVKARFLMLRSDHIEYVLSSMEKTTSKIKNIKKYLLAALYNAPMTIENYYSALVNHEIYVSVPEYGGR
jgi:hypothetical protein